MSFKELYLFSLYHEIGHCLDQNFLLKAFLNEREARDVHEAEAYAELLAYLALIPELGQEVASRRGVYRMVYSRVVGEYLAKHQYLDNQSAASSGAIYNLGPYLNKAYELIKFKELNLDKPLDEIAHKFVLDYAMSSREFYAVMTFLREGGEESNELYSKLAFEEPQFYFSAYMTLLQYQGYTSSLLNLAFTKTKLPEYEHLPLLDKEYLCKTLQQKDLETHLKILTDYRSVINKGVYEPKEIMTVYKELSNLDFSCEKFNK